MGDEGFVGRGNRGNGLINMTRAYSMEGASGKNPVYHVGMIYTESAQRIAKMLYERFSLKTDVFLTSQSGRALLDPKDVTIVLYGADSVQRDNLISAIRMELDRIPDITRDFLNGYVHLY
ncbi:MAG: methionine adenosyltransferase [Nanoarchaeota archaeon]